MGERRTSVRLRKGRAITKISSRIRAVASVLWESPGAAVRTIVAQKRDDEVVRQRHQVHRVAE